jgi:acetoin utilization deacetylase AcuC-like enzyme
VGNDAAFTFSVHCEANFPFRKERSDLDIGLAEGAGDYEYLSALEDGIALVLGCFAPDFIIYLAGADPHAGDRLGRLKVSTAGLLRRDEMVFELARRLDVPIAVTMAGGYGHDIEQTVAVHFNTVRAARASWAAHRRPIEQKRI